MSYEQMAWPSQCLPPISRDPSVWVRIQNTGALIRPSNSLTWLTPARSTPFLLPWEHADWNLKRIYHKSHHQCHTNSYSSIIFIYSLLSIHYQYCFVCIHPNIFQSATSKQLQQFLHLSGRSWQSVMGIRTMCEISRLCAQKNQSVTSNEKFVEFKWRKTEFV